MKPYYYTFEWKDRVITLCLAYLAENFTQDKDFDLNNDLFMGYAVKIPTDSINEDFAKKIALGRALKQKTSFFICTIEEGFGVFIKQDKGFLKAIARNCERNIKNGTIVIKGIR